MRDDFGIANILPRFLFCGRLVLMLKGGIHNRLQEFESISLVGNGGPIFSNSIAHAEGNTITGTHLDHATDQSRTIEFGTLNKACKAVGTDCPYREL